MKNNKGFTLTELLVTMAILAIITGISIPLIINIQQSQTKRKYKVYGETLISSAKLYNDSYGEDLFGKRESGCEIISYAELENKKLVKDIDMSGISCNSNKTMVKIQKTGKTYGYEYKIGCGAEKNGKAADIQVELPSKNDLDCTGDANVSMDVSVSPPKSNNVNSKIQPKVSIASSTGIAGESKLSYAWVKNWDINSTNYTSINDWQKVPFSKIQSIQEQKDIIASGHNVEIRSNTLSVPTGGSGDYYLIIRMDSLCNLNNEGCFEGANKYKAFGPYKRDKQAPAITKFEVISKTTGYNDKTVVVNYAATDDQDDPARLTVCVSKKPCEDSDYKAYDGSRELTLSDSLDGKEYTVYLGVKDKADNTTSDSKKYQVHKDCVEKVSDENWVDTSTCNSQCGGGTKTQKAGFKDKYTGNKCSGEQTREVDCGGTDCCAETITENVSTGKWSKCTRDCGGGTQSRSVTQRKVSKSDNSIVCEEAKPTTETQTCNTKPCTPYLVDSKKYDCNYNSQYSTKNNTCWLVTKSFKIGVSRYSGEGSSTGHYLVTGVDLYKGRVYNNEIMSQEQVNDLRIIKSYGYYTFKYVQDGETSGRLRIHIEK